MARCLLVFDDVEVHLLCKSLQGVASSSVCIGGVAPWCKVKLEMSLSTSITQFHQKVHKF
jgi:hypothetical protein